MTPARTSCGRHRGLVGARLGAYRWHVVDPIPFRRWLRFDIEHAGWTYSPDGSVRFEERADLFSSVAFWYQRGIAAGQPDLPYGAARLPIGNAQQIEVEQRAGEVKVERGKASVQKDVFWSKDILFFEGTGPGVALDGQSTASSTVLEHERGANAGDSGRIDGTGEAAAGSVGSGSGDEEDRLDGPGGT